MRDCNGVLARPLRGDGQAPDWPDAKFVTRSSPQGNSMPRWIFLISAAAFLCTSVTAATTIHELEAPDERHAQGRSATWVPPGRTNLTLRRRL